MFRLMLMILLLFTSPVFADEVIKLEPYSATYSVKYLGFKAGLVHFVLLPRENNTYLYLSRVEPGMLARLVVSPEAFERTILKIDKNGIRPLSWKSEDGSSNTADDGELTFDWESRRVFGTVEDEQVDMELEPNLQNRLSMQIEVLAALQQNSQPQAITLIDGDKIKQYTYELKDTQKVETAAGSYDTIIYESTREGSSRMKRIYHAPELDYLPVRIENYKKGSMDTVMELVAFDLKKTDNVAHQQAH